MTKTTTYTITPYDGKLEKRFIGNPALGLSVVSYLKLSKLGFTTEQTRDIVKSAYDENPNLIRTRHVGDKFLGAMQEVMGSELADYSTTPERFRRLKEMAAKVQRCKDMLISEGVISATYKNLLQLREYEPEEVVDLVLSLKEAGSKFPVWVLAKLNEDATRNGVSLENLVDRRLHQNGEGRSGFEDLDYMLGDSDDF